MKLVDSRSGRVLNAGIRRAIMPWTRTIGYLSRREVGIDEGLWFDRCSAIHTLGMRARIDVLFFDADGCIVGIEAPAATNRAVLRAPNAHAVLECGAGFVAASGVSIGDRLTLVGP